MGLDYFLMSELNNNVEGFVQEVYGIDMGE